MVDGGGWWWPAFGSSRRVTVTMTRHVMCLDLLRLRIISHTMTIHDISENRIHLRGISQQDEAEVTRNDRWSRTFHGPCLP